MSNVPDGEIPGTTTAAAETIDAGPDAPKPRPEHKDPESIGPYRILERIGEGGMGLVYKAEQRQPVRRIVALKVIKLGMDTSEVVARFEAERQALAMMSHPNVAKVFEAGMTEQGRPYFAMEFVAGVPLTDYCDEHKLSTKERLELFIAVCHAVQHAHQKGIIHRDLKPSNILVTLFDGQPVPKVIDFGIAKATNQALTQRTLFTQTGSLIGTPEYMSPEQAMTNGLDVDTRTDIYALGVILYELLVGSLPFDAKMLRAGGLDGIARMIKEVEPQKPSTRIGTIDRRPTPVPTQASLEEVARRHRTDARTLKREIQGDLDWITLKAMDKDRTRRYETANGLAQDIRRHLDNELVLARPPSTLYRLSKLARKYKAAAAAVGAVAAALLIAVIGTSIGFVRARSALHDAKVAQGIANEQKEIALHLLDDVKRAKAAAEKQAQRAEAANLFMRGMLGSAPVGAKGGGSDLKVTDMLDRAADQLDKLQGQPDLELDGRLAIAATFSSLNQYQKAVDNYQRALTLSRSPGGAESEQTLQITADLLLAMSQANAAEAIPLGRDAIATAQRVLGPRHPVTLDMLNSMGLVWYSAEQYPRAETIFRDLIRQARQEGYVPHRKGSARFFNNLALVLTAQGRLPAAEKVQREAIEIAKEEKDNDPRRTARLLHNLASTLAEQNKLADAERAFRDAVEYERKSLSESHPQALESSEALAGLLEQQEKYSDALPLRQELSKRLFLRHGGESEEGIGHQLAAAELLLRTGKDQSARALFADSIARLWKLGGKDKAILDNARRRWAQSTLLQGLRVDKPWKGRAIKFHATRTAYWLLYAHSWGEPSPDLVDWENLRFKIQPWRPALADKPRPFEGGLADLWTTPDPEPGLYYFSLTIRRHGTGPIRTGYWMLIAPWKLAVHLAQNPDFSDPTKAQALFEAEPFENRTEPTLTFDRVTRINQGFGPGYRVSGYAISATANVKLPPGKYRVRGSSDGYCLIFCDGAVAVDVGDNNSGQPRMPIDMSTAHNFRVQWVRGSDQLDVGLEPLDRAAAALVTATVGTLDPVVSKLEQSDDQIAREPPSAQLFSTRAYQRLGLGRFNEADDDYVKSIALDPTDHWAWYYRGCLLAYLGNEQAYREHCRAMLARFGKATQPFTRERTVKTCLLLPGVAEDPASLRTAAEEVVKGGGEFLPWYEMSKGIAEYRTGKYAAAIESLASSEPKLGSRQGEVTSALFQAMALKKLEKPTEAQAAFDRARGSLQRGDQTPGVDDLGHDGPENWLITHTVLREAYETLGIAPPATRPATNLN